MLLLLLMLLLLQIDVTTCKEVYKHTGCVHSFTCMHKLINKKIKTISLYMKKILYYDTWVFSFQIH